MCSNAFLACNKPNQSLRVERGGKVKGAAYIYDVVEDHERCSLCLCLIANAYLSYASVVEAKEVEQIIA